MIGFGIGRWEENLTREGMCLFDWNLGENGDEGEVGIERSPMSSENIGDGKVIPPYQNQRGEGHCVLTDCGAIREL
jgi:hypothetical protein